MAVIIISMIGLLLIKYNLINNEAEKTISSFNESLTGVPQAQDVKKISQIVCIDPGHGGYDAGSISKDGTLEKNLVLQVATKVGNALKNKGVTVIYTRNNDLPSWPADNKKDLSERVNISKENNSDLFVSIHCNNHENSSFKGIEMWTRFPNNQGNELAKSILDEVKSINYTDNRGIKYEKEKRIKVLKENPVPSVLIELGFISNSEDFKFIASKSGQEVLADKIAEGILKYINKNQKSEHEINN